MKQRLIRKKVTAQDGTSIGTVKDVIVDSEKKDFTLVVSKGRGGETEIPWTEVVSIEDVITLAGEGTAAGERASSEINLNNIGTVKILFYSDCPHYVQTTQDIKEVLIEEGLSASLLSVDLARAPDVEKEMPFAGSPTVLLNGKDIAPGSDQFRGPTGGNCRLYEYEGEAYDYPPKELIREALAKKHRHRTENERATSQRKGGTPQTQKGHAEDVEETPEEIDVIYEVDIVEIDEDEVERKYE